MSSNGNISNINPVGTFTTSANTTSHTMIFLGVTPTDNTVFFIQQVDPKSKN